MTGKEISKWADDFMYKSEERKASEGIKVSLLGAQQDPLGQIAACAKMYKGEVVHDLKEITDAEREEYLIEIQKTVLKMPLEAVNLHFMIDGVHRGITHQMVRQRTAAFAQESMRFAVKENMADAVALPPSLDDTLSMEDYREAILKEDEEIGITRIWRDEDLVEHAVGRQKWRLKWDQANIQQGATYMDLINDGMPAEDARGLTPTNITTRLNYLTNLRGFYDTMAVRCSDQAQFEWRVLIMEMARAMIRYGEQSEYKVWVPFVNHRAIPGFIERDSSREDHGQRGSLPEMSAMPEEVVIIRSSAWQFRALAEAIKPIEFIKGGRAFGANFDRPSRIGERIDAFVKCGIPSSEWTKGSDEHAIPPIHPEEWLMDPNSARLADGMEFDIFGTRVKKGTGLHWKDGRIVHPNGEEVSWAERRG